ncbi:MAG: hypothetical protein OEQ13_06545 [Acidobacteriota bacterium]|nr:hypothetical protein [Acidobacteriota bacterium]
MSDERPEIFVTDSPIEPDHLARLVEAWFGEMVKIVVDDRKNLIAIGGELHADAEDLGVARNFVRFLCRNSLGRVPGRGARRRR